MSIIVPVDIILTQQEGLVPSTEVQVVLDNPVGKIII